MGIIAEIVSDLPLLFTFFFCMWCVFGIYLPKRKRIVKWISLISLELFEHLILPLIIIIIFLFTNDWKTFALFQLVLLSFFFVFLGKVVIKAKGSEWFRIIAITVFAYFFIFIYPSLIIVLQLYIFKFYYSGLIILILTNIFFFIFYRMKLSH